MPSLQNILETLEAAGQSLKDARKKSAPYVTATYAGLKNTANFVYGAAATEYTLEFTNFLQQTSTPNVVFDTLAPVATVIGAFGVLDALRSEYQLLQRMYHDDHGLKANWKTDWRHVDNLLKAASSGAVVAAGSTYFSTAVTLGSSVALEYLCGAIALQATAKLIKDIKRFWDANRNLTMIDAGTVGSGGNDAFADEETKTAAKKSANELLNKARSDLALSLMNFIGWTALALAHVPALAAAAPVLIGLGAASLVAAGLYAGYTAYKNYTAPDKDKTGRGIGVFCKKQANLEVGMDALADEASLGKLKPKTS
jgi:hypothetical protein